MATFDLLAAIDLRGGRVVRLREGDFARETAYRDDPVDVAVELVEQGVPWLHVVDLDGARTGAAVHGPVIARLIAAVSGRACVEVGGGLRSANAVAGVLAAGADRVVIGSAALADPRFAAAAVTRHGSDRIAVAIDVRGGDAVGQAWQPGVGAAPLERVFADLVEAGVAWFEVTAIARDGSLAGPDLELLAVALSQVRGQHVIASGGIATVEDLIATWTLGCAGAIVGRGLYEGTFDIARAVRATRSST